MNDGLPRHFKRPEDKFTACGIQVRLGRKTDNPREVTCEKCRKALATSEQDNERHHTSSSGPASPPERKIQRASA